MRLEPQVCRRARRHTCHHSKEVLTALGAHSLRTSSRSQGWSGTGHGRAWMSEGTVVLASGQPGRVDTLGTHGHDHKNTVLRQKWRVARKACGCHAEPTHCPQEPSRIVRYGAAGGVRSTQATPGTGCGAVWWLVGGGPCSRRRPELRKVWPEVLARVLCAEPASSGLGAARGRVPESEDSRVAIEVPVEGVLLVVQGTEGKSCIFPKKQTKFWVYFFF